MGDPSDPLSLNRYVYCGLDPVNFCDPTGFMAFPLSPWLNQSWRAFQTDVGTFNNAVRGTLQNGRIIDWIAEGGRAIEAKFVQNIRNTDQLKQFISDYGSNFELWISNYTKSINPELLEQIKETGGKVVQFVNGVKTNVNIQQLIENGGKLLEEAEPYIAEAGQIGAEIFMGGGL